MTILIQGDRIADIQPTTSAELAALSARPPVSQEEQSSSPSLIDGRGLFAIPGLIDTDVHLQSEGSDSALMRSLLANGITMVLDTGNSSPQTFQRHRLSLSESFVGPRIEVSGPFIAARPTGEPGTTVVSTTQQIRQVIRSLVSGGARFASFDASLPPALSYDVIRLAERRGLRVVGHLGRTNALEATAFGIDIIATLSGLPDSAVSDPERVRAQHLQGFSEGWPASSRAWLRADPAQLKELIGHLVANHVALSPSLWLQKTYATLGADTSEKQDAVRFSDVSSAALSRWLQFNSNTPDSEIYARAWPVQASFLKNFVRSGGWIIAGSDSPHPYVPPGFGLHLELETMEDAGIPPFEVLKAATVLASRAMGHEQEYGSIEIGNRADLLLVEGNPIEHIKNTRHVRTVFRSGIPYDPQELLRGLPR